MAPQRPCDAGTDKGNRACHSASPSEVGELEGNRVMDTAANAPRSSARVTHRCTG